jgi:glycosyltransferase involved in cell wall biosynthesis
MRLTDLSVSTTARETRESGERRVTVIIPVWGDYVDLAAEAVASVRAQGTQSRTIVVDNASDPPIAPFEGCDLARSETRLSRGEIRNFGLSLVTTEYLVFLDADDLLLPGALARLVSGLDACPDCPVLVAGIIEPGGARHRTPRRLASILARRPRLFAWANAVWSLMPTQGSAIMRTAAVDEVGGFADASHGEDWALGASLAFRGEIVFDRQPVLIYRWRLDSPGAERTPPRILLQNARRVRGRLRADPAVGAGTWALGILAIAQVLAVIAQPLVRATRRLLVARGSPERAPGGSANR